MEFTLFEILVIIIMLSINPNSDAGKETWTTVQPWSWKESYDDFLTDDPHKDNPTKWIGIFPFTSRLMLLDSRAVLNLVVYCPLTDYDLGYEPYLISVCWHPFGTDRAYSVCATVSREHQTDYLLLGDRFKFSFKYYPSRKEALIRLKTDDRSKSLGALCIFCRTYPRRDSNEYRSFRGESTHELEIHDMRQLSQAGGYKTKNEKLYTSDSTADASSFSAFGNDYQFPYYRDTYSLTQLAGGFFPVLYDYLVEWYLCPKDTLYVDAGPTDTCYTNKSNDVFYIDYYEFNGTWSPYLMKDFHKLLGGSIKAGGPVEKRIKNHRLVCYLNGLPVKYGDLITASSDGSSRPTAHGEPKFETRFDKVYYFQSAGVSVLMPFTGLPQKYQHLTPVIYHKNNSGHLQRMELGKYYPNISMSVQPSNFTGPGPMTLRFRGPSPPKMEEIISITAAYYNEKTKKNDYTQEYEFRPLIEEEGKPVNLFSYDGDINITCPRFKSTSVSWYYVLEIYGIYYFNHNRISTPTVTMKHRKIEVEGLLRRYLNRMLDFDFKETKNNTKFAQHMNTVVFRIQKFTYNPHKPNVFSMFCVGFPVIWSKDGKKSRIVGEFARIPLTIRTLAPTYPTIKLENHPCIDFCRFHCLLYNERKNYNPKITKLYIDKEWIVAGKVIKQFEQTFVYFPKKGVPIPIMNCNVYVQGFGFKKTFTRGVIFPKNLTLKIVTRQGSSQIAQHLSTVISFMFVTLCAIMLF